MSECVECGDNITGEVCKHTEYIDPVCKECRIQLVVEAIENLSNEIDDYQKELVTLNGGK